MRVISVSIDREPRGANCLYSSWVRNQNFLSYAIAAGSKSLFYKLLTDLKNTVNCYTRLSSDTWILSILFILLWSITWFIIWFIYQSISPGQYHF